VPLCIRQGMPRRLRRRRLGVTAASRQRSTFRDDLPHSDAISWWAITAETTEAFCEGTCERSRSRWWPVDPI